MSLHLTKQQVAVCCLVASGDSDKRVGEALGISVPAVRFHLYLSVEAIDRAFPRRYLGSPREIVEAWYRDCRREAFNRKRAA